MFKLMSISSTNESIVLLPPTCQERFGPTLKPAVLKEPTVKTIQLYTVGYKAVGCYFKHGQETTSPPTSGTPNIEDALANKMGFAQKMTAHIDAGSLNRDHGCVAKGPPRQKFGIPSSVA